MADRIQKIRHPFGLNSVENLGTVATGVTAVEYGTDREHITVLTINSTMPAIAGGAALAVGKLLYTLPTGVQEIEACDISVALTAVDGNIDADTPDVGIGMVIASGAVAVLSGTATFENILTGQTATNCTGTAIAAAVNTDLAVASSAAKTIYLNIADTWAASGEAALPVTGTVTIKWSTIS